MIRLYSLLFILGAYSLNASTEVKEEDKYSHLRKINIILGSIKINDQEKKIEDLNNFSLKLFNLRINNKIPLAVLDSKNKKEEISLILPKGIGAWMMSLESSDGLKCFIGNKDMKFINGDTFGSYIDQNKYFLTSPSNVKFLINLKQDEKKEYQCSIVPLQFVRNNFIMESIINEVPENFKYESWVVEVQKRGEKNLQYKNFDEYKMIMQQKKLPLSLVVGCGHNAYRFTEKNKLTGSHFGYEIYSHENAFTINLNLGGKLYPDIEGLFPNKMPENSKGQFSEIYFENVDGGTTKYYKDAFEYLRPGGKIIDDGHNEFNEVKNKFEASEALLRAGFTDVKFIKLSKNPHNLRESLVVVAQKP